MKQLTLTELCPHGSDGSDCTSMRLAFPGLDAHCRCCGARYNARGGTVNVCRRCTS